MSPTQPSQGRFAELPEPSVGNSAVPIWLIMLAGALFYWAAVFVDDRAAGFDPQIYAPFTSETQLANYQPYDPARSFLAEGENVYKTTCSSCHQPDGKGKEGQFPPLAGSDWLLAPSVTRTGRIVLKGLGGSIRVMDASGAPHSLNGNMLPWGETYNDYQLAAVLSWARQQWGNNAPMVLPDEIKAIRAQVASHPGPFNPDELLKLPLEPLKPFTPEGLPKKK